LRLSLVLAFVSAAAAQEPAPAPAAASLAKGDAIPGFEALGLNGVPYRVDFPKEGPTTVLLVFLAGCPICKSMLPLWSEAFARKPESLKVQAIMLDAAPPGFFAFYNVPFPVLRASDGRELSRLLKVRRVPMTVRVQPGGAVDDVAEGKLERERLAELFRPAGGS
jgi:hypothetical protein